MKRYSEYKDSGVEWIGEIPSHWNVLSMRHLLQLIQTGSTPSTSVDEFFDGDIKWFTPGDFCDDKYLNNCNRCLTRVAIDKNEAKLLPKNTVLLVGIGATLGKVAMLSEESSFNQQITGLVTNKKIIPKFLYYWLKMNTNTLLKTSNFTTLPIVNNEFIKSFPTICTSIEEQERIIKYLDKKTSQIEELVSKKEELIETIKASRIKLISETVTKGLDKNVPMKDSGVKWERKIPRHWEITSIRNLVMMNKIELQDGNHGELHPTSDDYIDYGVPFIMASDIKDNKVNFDKCKYIPYDLSKKLRIGFSKRNDVLMTHKGTIGEVAIVDSTLEYPYIVLTPQVTYYRIKDKELLDSEFLFFMMQSNLVQKQLKDISSMQSTRAYVGIVAQRAIKLIIPSIKEQKEIAEQLNIKVAKIDDILNKTKTQIELLKKAKQKLITEVVTGKIDVTNL